MTAKIQAAGYSEMENNTFLHLISPFVMSWRVVSRRVWCFSFLLIRIVFQTLSGT